MSASTIVAVPVRQSGMIKQYGSNSGVNAAASAPTTRLTPRRQCPGTPCGRPPTLPATKESRLATGCRATAGLTWSSGPSCSSEYPFIVPQPPARPPPGSHARPRIIVPARSPSRKPYESSRNEIVGAEVVRLPHGDGERDHGNGGGAAARGLRPAVRRRRSSGDGTADLRHRPVTGLARQLPGHRLGGRRRGGVDLRPRLVAARGA